MQLKSRLFFLFLLGAFSFSSFSQPVDFNIDPWHSSVQFKVPFWAVSHVSGRFDRFFGTVRFDRSNIDNCAVEFVVDAASINTGRDRRDDDLRKTYFNVDLHPGIVFEGKEFKKDGDTYIATGTLILRGISREIDIPFQIIEYVEKDASNPRDEMGLAVGPVSLKRSDYNMHQGLPIFKDDRIFVGDEVELNFLLRLIEINKDFSAQYPGQSLSTDELAIHQGTYISDNQEDTYSVQLFGNKLAIQVDENGDFARLLPIGPSKFRNRYQAFAEFKEENGEQLLIYTRKGKNEEILRKKADNKSIATVISRMISKKGVEAGIDHYKSLKEKMSGEYTFRENALNRVGYRLLVNERKTGEAIAIFKLNLSEYPASARAHYALGYAYMVDKKNDLALEKFDRALEIDPSHKNAKKMIRKIRGE